MPFLYSLEIIKSKAHRADQKMPVRDGILYEFGLPVARQPLSYEHNYRPKRLQSRCPAY